MKILEMNVTLWQVMVSVMFLITTDMVTIDTIIIPIQTISTIPTSCPPFTPITLQQCGLTIRGCIPGPSGQRTMVRPGYS